MILVVVQPKDHGRVLGNHNEKVTEAAQPVLAESFNLLQHHGAVVNLGVARGEDVMPEEGHLLLQRPWSVDQTVHPLGLAVGGIAASVLRRRVMSIEVVLVHVGNAVTRRVHHLFHYGFIAFVYVGLQLVAGSAEAGPPH